MVPLHLRHESRPHELRPAFTPRCFVLSFLARVLPPHRATSVVKPKLLIVELWGLGDLVIATPFLRAAAEEFDVTLVAKPFARDLQARFWPQVNVLTFVAPWTAFKGKY